MVVNDGIQTKNNTNETANIELENKEMTSGEEIRIDEKNVSASNELVYKPTSLPKAGSTIYFLILPIGGILILIYCIFKKKDENF